jgi:imidazolonepropionase-like amidohydrolase
MLLTNPRLLVLAALAAWSPPALAQDVTVVRAARMLDVARGQIVSPAVVTIQGDRIRSLGQAPDSGAHVIDLGDVTLLPGLIDAHTHLTMDLDGEWVTRAIPQR